MKRKRWEAQVAAAELGKMLAEMLGARQGRGEGTQGKHARVPASALLGEMGLKIKPRKSAS